MKRYVSGPALELFRRSGLLPNDVDAALDALVQNKAGAILRKNHPLLKDVERATGINIVQIMRKSRYLLIAIEQQSKAGAVWQYREHAPRNCIFSCVGRLPATVLTGLQGEPLNKLISPSITMDGVLINRIEENADGWLTVDVTPPWHLF